MLDFSRCLEYIIPIRAQIAKPGKENRMRPGIRTGMRDTPETESIQYLLRTIEE